jgi:hypothetical protein
MSLPQYRMDALDALGFDWGISRQDIWTKNLLALKTYKAMYGHVNIPRRFIVPIDDQRWPADMRGMKLGTLAHNLRQRKEGLSPNQLHALEALGFNNEFSLDEDSWRTNLLALTTFDEIYGHMRVPQNFVVPDDDDVWPEVTHGIKLGHVVYYLRRRKDSLSQNQIDALNFFGFEWEVLG